MPAHLPVHLLGTRSPATRRRACRTRTAWRTAISSSECSSTGAPAAHRACCFRRRCAERLLPPAQRLTCCPSTPRAFHSPRLRCPPQHPLHAAGGHQRDAPAGGAPQVGAAWAVRTCVCGPESVLGVAPLPTPTGRPPSTLQRVPSPALHALLPGLGVCGAHLCAAPALVAAGSHHLVAAGVSGRARAGAPGAAAACGRSPLSPASLPLQTPLPLPQQVLGCWLQPHRALPHVLAAALPHQRLVRG